jgi:hypothetical protein
MAGFSEPTTEDEAKRLKEFLEAGAGVELNTVRSFDAIEGVEVSIGKPAVLAFDTQFDEVTKLAAEQQSRLVLVDLELDGIDREHDYSAALVLGEEAIETITEETKGLIGSIGFFCEVDGPEGIIICPVKPDHPLNYRLDATQVMSATDQGGQLRISIFLVPPPDREPREAGLSVAKASVVVADSVVKPAG